MPEGPGHAETHVPEHDPQATNDQQPRPPPGPTKYIVGGNTDCPRRRSWRSARPHSNLGDGRLADKSNGFRPGRIGEITNEEWLFRFPAAHRAKWCLINIGVIVVETSVFAILVR